MTHFRFMLAAGLLAISLSTASAQTLVPLQKATATFSQAGDTVDRAIDGVTDNFGWAIDAQEGVNQTAAFQTVSNVGSPGGSLLTFTFTQLHTNPGHILGKFRLSATTDNRSSFADGLATGGNVTANWTVLGPSSAVSLNGATMSILGDGAVLSGGTRPNTDIYTITAPTSLIGITGIRLETLTDASLPVNGPGRAFNGNFVLTEFRVGITAVTPEPGTWAMFVGMTVSGGLFLKRRKRADR